MDNLTSVNRVISFAGKDRARIALPPTPHQSRVYVPIDPDSTEPLYRQVARAIKDQILDGELPPGTRLPHLRAAANEIGVSFQTVQLAYKALERDGFLRCGRSGARVLERGPQAKPDRVAIMLDALREAVINLAQNGVRTEEMVELVRETSSAGEREIES